MNDILPLPEHDRERAGEPGVRVIPLIEAEFEPSDLLPHRAARSDYSLAADNGSSRLGRKTGEQDGRVRTFISDSGVYVVRIFPNEKGRGATAVIIHTDEAGEKHQGVAPGTPKPFLRFDGLEISFDGNGSASLDSSPDGTVELILRP